MTTSQDTTLTLSGVWEGNLSANPPGGNILPIAASSPTVIATGPNLAQAVAHMKIGIWSAARSVFHPGGEEGGGYFSVERTYLGGISLDRQVSAGSSMTIHEPFNVSVTVPRGGFYFYASQSLETGGGSDASQGLGGSVYADVVTAANFDHTLKFNLVPDPATGATLTSESGEFLTLVPPVLDLMVSGNQIVLNWPGTATGYVLETSTPLASDNSWLPVNSGINTTGGHFVFSTDVTGAPAFYRLTRP